MKIFVVVIILGACIGPIIGSKCSSGHITTLDIDPYCGYLPDCYMNADNPGNLRHMSCYRAEKGLPDFIRTKRGPCPKDKPEC